MKTRPAQVNTKHILGLFLIAISLLSSIGAFGWVLGYMDNSFQETYRDHDIYYFPNPNVYGVDISGDPSGWPFNSGLQGCKNMIDSWLDDPKQVETYRDFEIYQIQGFMLYYGVNGEAITGKWRHLEDLKEYIDTEYYPTRVKTFTNDQNTWIIYRQGYNPVQYWAETDGFKSPDFSSLKEARDFVREKIGSEPPIIVDENPETPSDQDPLPGNPPKGLSIGDRLDTQREIISGISGIFGLGFIALGEAERRDND
jgi:hypothetical protein